jgi:hypothetical protein
MSRKNFGALKRHCLISRLGGHGRTSAEKVNWRYTGDILGDTLGVDHVHVSDGLPLGMLGVGDGVLHYEGGRRRPVAAWFLIVAELYFLS